MAIYGHALRWAARDNRLAEPCRTLICAQCGEAFAMTVRRIDAYALAGRPLTCETCLLREEAEEA